MNTNTSSSLWGITRGQRSRYVGAVIAMALMNFFMFGAPLIGKYAIDVVDQGDFALAQPHLLALSESLSGAQSYVTYLALSAIVAILMTALGGIFLYVRGRLAEGEAG